MPDIHADRVLILDFGAQYTQLIARRVRELGVYSEIYACDADAAEIARFKPKAVILSGGPESVYEVRSAAAPPEVFELGVPVLGICYGMQEPWRRSSAARLSDPRTVNSVRHRRANPSGTRGCSTASRIIAMPRVGAYSMCG